MNALGDPRTPPSGSQLSRLLARAARKLRTAFSDESRRRSWRHQFDFWEERGETDSVLEAIGVERGQIPLFIRRISAGERLMAAMRARIGLKSRRKPAPSQNEALWVCALCRSHEQCERWLESGATKGFEAFCPNASALDDERRQPD